MKALRGYGVLLRPLEATDLEMVRQWRNAAHVRENFELQGEITPENQQKWFREMDKSRNYYWVIVRGNEDVGVIHAKEIDWESKRAEAGIFIGEKRQMGGSVAGGAILAMMDYLFGELEFEELRAKVKAEAKENVKLNRQLGYEILPGQQDQAFPIYRCTRTAYYSAFRSRFPGP